MLLQCSPQFTQVAIFLKTSYLRRFEKCDILNIGGDNILDTERINLHVDTGTADMLTALAGGERRRGKYISRLINAIYHNQESEPTELDDLKLSFRGMAATQKTLEQRVAKMEIQLEL